MVYVSVGAKHIPLAHNTPCCSWQGHGGMTFARYLWKQTDNCDHPRRR